jgi:hypothetical protein
MSQTGNNYSISNKFQEICLVLYDEDIGNQKIRTSKNLFVDPYDVFLDRFFKKQSCRAKLKPIGLVTFPG